MYLHESLIAQLGKNLGSPIHTFYLKEIAFLFSFCPISYPIIFIENTSIQVGEIAQWARAFIM